MRLSGRMIVFMTENNTPELAISLYKEYREKGIGTVLMKHVHFFKYTIEESKKEEQDSNVYQTGNGKRCFQNCRDFCL